MACVTIFYRHQSRRCGVGYKLKRFMQLPASTYQIIAIRKLATLHHVVVYVTQFTVVIVDNCC